MIVVQKKKCSSLYAKRNESESLNEGSCPTQGIKMNCNKIKR